MADEGALPQELQLHRHLPLRHGRRPVPEPWLRGDGGVKGEFGKVKLDGLSWVVTYHWPGPLHEGNGSVQAFIDRRATEEQRSAIIEILSGRAGNPWFEILASLVTTIHEPRFVPITFKFDKGKRKARVLIPDTLETVSAPLTVPATGQEQRVILRMPGGMEYKEMEVAQAVILKGMAAIQFNHRNTHSSLADVEQTHAGLKR